MTTTYVSAMRDLLLDLSGVYPAMVRAGVGYWSEMAANSTTCCAGLAEDVVAAWRNPRHQDQIAADAIARIRTYLERSGDGLERALLELNNVLVGLAQRGPAASGSAAGESAPPVGPDPLTDERILLERASNPSDLHGLREHLERLLNEVRRREARLEPPPPRSAP